MSIEDVIHKCDNCTKSADTCYCSNCETQMLDEAFSEGKKEGLEESKNE